MEKYYRIILLIIPLVFAVTFAVPVHAQSQTSKPIIYAEVDQTDISTDDTIILTVTVDLFETSLSKPSDRTTPLYPQ